MAITGENPVVKAEVQEPYKEPTPPKAASRVLRTIGAMIVIVGAAIVGAGAYIYIHHQIKHEEKKEAASSQSPPDQKVSDNPTQAHLRALSGTWTNPQAQDGKPLRIQIAAQGEMASIHMWSRCGASICDLGTKSVPLSGDGITTQWTGEFSNAGNEQIAAQTISVRIYRQGAGLHMIYYGTQTGSTGFDFVRGQ